MDVNKVSDNILYTSGFVTYVKIGFEVRLCAYQMPCSGQNLECITIFINKPTYSILVLMILARRDYSGVDE